MSLTRAEFPRFSGAETEWDFVEAPSQIMEHWTWEPSVLDRFARHYATGEPIPPELVEQMARCPLGEHRPSRRRSRRSTAGIDLALHAEPEAPDVEAALRQHLRHHRHAVPRGNLLPLPASGTFSAGTTPATTATCGPRSSATTCSAASPRGHPVARGRGGVPARDPRAQRLARRRRAGARVPRAASPPTTSSCASAAWGESPRVWPGPRVNAGLSPGSLVIHRTAGQITPERVPVRRSAPR